MMDKMTFFKFTIVLLWNIKALGSCAKCEFYIEKNRKWKGEDKKEYACDITTSQKGLQIRI